MFCVLAKFIYLDLAPNKKKALAEEITESFVRITGCKPSAVEIIFKEITKENSGSSGKLLG